MRFKPTSPVNPRRHFYPACERLLFNLIHREEDERGVCQENAFLSLGEELAKLGHRLEYRRDLQLEAAPTVSISSRASP